MRIFFAPFQRLPDDFVFVRAGELLQKSLATFLINERSERTALRTPPGVQLNRKVAVINAALKRWRIPQLLRVTDTRYRQQANKLVESGGAPRLQASGGARFYTAVFRRGPELQGMNPEGESIKPDNEDQNDSKDIDTEDIDSDKTEGDELKQ